MFRRLFFLRREERWLFLGLLIFAVCLCALNIQSSFDFFSRFVKGGYWTMMKRAHNISGYDQYILVDLSRPQDLLPHYRHPLLVYMLYPGYLLNQWLISTFHINCCQIIIATWNAIAASYAGIFLYRILHEVMQASRLVSTLLCCMFFSFGHIMLTILVPDHFCTSLFLLLLAFYAASLEWTRGIRSSLFWALMFFLSAGVTLTNGCLVAIASWYALGTRQLFNLRHITLAFILPLLLLAGATWFEYSEYGFFYTPKNEKAVGLSRIESKSTRKEFVNMKVNRMEALVENVCGETIQLHSNHLLGDYQRGERPMVVRYQNAIPYIIEALMLLLFAFAIWMGRHNRYLWMIMGCLAFNAALHLGFGFGIDEPYIFAAHWAYAIPIVYAILARMKGFAWLIGSLAVYLLISNLWFMVPYFIK